MKKHTAALFLILMALCSAHAQLKMPAPNQPTKPAAPKPAAPSTPAEARAGVTVTWQGSGTVIIKIDDRELTLGANESERAMLRTGKALKLVVETPSKNYYANEFLKIDPSGGDLRVSTSGNEARFNYELPTQKRLREEHEREAALARAEAEAEVKRKAQEMLKHLEDNMVYVAGGTFSMGCRNLEQDSCYADAKLMHQVTLKGYYINKHEVTQEFFQTIMGFNPSYFKATAGIGVNFKKREDGFFEITTIYPGGAASSQGELEVGDIILNAGNNNEKPFELYNLEEKDFINALTGEKNSFVRIGVKKSNGKVLYISLKRKSIRESCEKCPVENVNWHDVQEFIIKLNSLTNKNFRLPTEAEWEYAARGGSQSQGDIYSGSNDIGSVAWYSSNSGSKTHPVGLKQPNELGLYDMSGNVFEWCSDWFNADYYTNSPKLNPKGPSSGTHRVVRGGSWVFDAWYCRVSNRYRNSPDYRSNLYGFRLAQD